MYDKLRLLLFSKFPMPYDYRKCRDLLNRGDELCRSREIPMPSAVIKKVKEIYKKCKWLLILHYLGDTPLIHATRLGFANLVWGFIQYGKQTNTDPNTNKTWDLQKFLGYKNSRGQTALDMVFENNLLLKVDLEAFALEDVSWQELITDRNNDGETLMSLLSNQGYDEIIFKAMKAAGKGKVDPSLTSISISVDEDNHQESIVYTEHTHPNTHSLVSQYEPSRTLNKLDDGQLELDPNGNTIFHFLSQIGDDAKLIFEKHPSLLYRRNHQGETPIFVASMLGRLDVLEFLIYRVKEKGDLKALATRSMDNYTALHIAIENHHVPIVFWLANRLPQLANSINIFNESPLYFAAQRGYHHILRLILDASKEKSFEGPNGKTALHAAVMSQESVEYYTHASQRGVECVKALLREKIDLLYIHDKNGLAPFFYAVYHGIETETVEALLEADPNIGYQNMTVDGINTPAIHIAATQGHWHTIDLLVDKCPYSRDITDSKGRNILHVAVENRRIDIIKELFGDKRFRTLANQRDSDGNTPLHLFMASDIEIDEMKMDRGVNIYAVNNKNLTTLDVSSSSEKRRMLIKAVETGVWRNLQTSSPSHEMSHDSKNESEIAGQGITKFGDSLVVVTALIATASFAAAFTVPGGFDGNEGSKQGMPILLTKAAYKAFIVSNAVAFSCSCCVLFGYIRLQNYLAVFSFEEKKEDKKEDIGLIISLQYVLTGIAMVAMVSAFITGSYVILAPSLAFAISLCATCVCIVPLSFFPTKYFKCFRTISFKIFMFLEFK